MAQHTPGPWRVTTDDGVWVVCDKPHGETGIAVVAGYCERPERLANARLIAEAPAMLEALTRAVEAHGPFGDDSRPEWWPDACALIGRA